MTRGSHADGPRTAPSVAHAQEPSLFRALFEKTHAAVSLVDAEGTTRYVSPSVWRLLGWNADGPGVEAPSDRVVPEDRARLTREREQLVRSRNREMHTEFRMQHRDGSTVWIESSVTNLLDEPDVHAIAYGYRDVTARKHAEASLRESLGALQASEERYRRIVENTTEGVWMYDTGGITTFVNARMAEMMGRTTDEMIGQPIYAFVDESRHAAVEARVERRRNGERERSDFQLRRKDGTPLLVSVHAAPLLDAQKKFDAVLALVTDVTEERRAEEARAHLAAIVESSDDAIISLSLDGVIASWNRGAERLYQHRAADIVGRSIAVVIPTEDREEERRNLERITHGESVRHYEAKRIRRDGVLVEVAVTVSPVRDARGEVIGIAKIVRDLTAQRQTEAALRRTEEQFRQAQKMDAVGRLAGGVAHDFNNLLSVILSYSSMVLEDLKDGDPLRDDVAEIHAAGKRAAELTRQLLTFSRQQVVQPRAVEINGVITGMKSMLGRLLGEHIELTMLPSLTAGRVLADPSQIEQIVMNLAVNARDAMPRGGLLTIETSNVELDDGYVGHHFGVTPGPYVMVAVSDNGIGMDAATVARIFEPFFTTKEKGKGTGLGLSTVFGIVDQSGGHVSVYSEPGLGTTFKIFIPRTARATEPAVGPVTPVVLQGSETILLVEDEDQVRVVACEILRRNGYNVLETSNAGEAFLAARDFRSEIHLLLTDVVMPRMSGRQLAEEMTLQRPELRTLFTSGYTDDAIVQHGLLGAGTAFLQKPFTPDLLLRRVREVLDARVPSG